MCFQIQNISKASLFSIRSDKRIVKSSMKGKGILMRKGVLIQKWNIDKKKD